MIIQPTFSLVFINSASSKERLRDITVSSWVNKRLQVAYTHAHETL